MVKREVDETGDAFWCVAKVYEDSLELHIEELREDIDKADLEEDTLQSIIDKVENEVNKTLDGELFSAIKGL
jgi:hypothetical protein